MKELWARQESTTGECTFYVKSNFESEATEQYGAAAGWTSVHINSNQTIDVEVLMVCCKILPTMTENKQKK